MVMSDHVVLERCLFWSYNLYIAVTSDIPWNMQQQPPWPRDANEFRRKPTDAPATGFCVVCQGKSVVMTNASIENGPVEIMKNGDCP